MELFFSPSCWPWGKRRKSKWQRKKCLTASNLSSNFKGTFYRANFNRDLFPDTLPHFFLWMRPACYLVSTSEQHLISPLDPVNTSWKATPIMMGHCLSRSGIHSSGSQGLHPCRSGSTLCLGWGPQPKSMAQKGKGLLASIYSAAASSPASL